jgi:chromatin structure-remodeling complex subunit RSC9
MWEHIVGAHLGIMKEQGTYVLDPLDTSVHYCCWAGCSRFDGIKAAPAYAIGMHVKTHMPDSSNDAAMRKEHNVSEATGLVATIENRAWPMHSTLTDEHYDAVGMPLTAVLVLRNLARMLPKTSAGIIETTQEHAGEGQDKISAQQENILWTYFGGVKEELYYVMAHNQPLREYIAPLVSSITA